jgi:AcrR family transcriptional regulator
MPRPYQLGLRAAAKAGTRERILTAALHLLRERGLAGASTVAIARAADVAPATVRNHFPDRTELARATFQALLSELRVPTPAIFDGLATRSDRLARLAHELAALYERSEPWWRAYEREPALVSAWAGGVDRYYADVDRLMRAALGALADDDAAMAVVAAVIGPPTFFALRNRGMTSAEAVQLTLDLIVPWLEAREGLSSHRR